MRKASDVTKWVAAQNPASLASKGRLIFRIPLGIILLGVYLDQSSPLTRTSVCCVILPLCKPVDFVYYENGLSLGFSGHYSFYGGDLTNDENIRKLGGIVLDQMLPAWDRLSDVEQCIEYLTSVPLYKSKEDGAVIESLVCLSAYQRTYDRCQRFIQDWREFLLTETGERVIASNDFSFQARKIVVETVEKCILSKDYELLSEHLNKWYLKSVTKLGLSQFARVKGGH